jgi:hypothetical protein
MRGRVLVEDLDLTQAGTQAEIPFPGAGIGAVMVELLRNGRVQDAMEAMP